jgi:hypothetical protein
VLHMIFISLYYVSTIFLSYHLYDITYLSPMRLIPSTLDRCFISALAPRIFNFLVALIPTTLLTDLHLCSYSSTPRMSDQSVSVIICLS